MSFATSRTSWQSHPSHSCDNPTTVTRLKTLPFPFTYNRAVSGGTNMSQATHEPAVANLTTGWPEIVGARGRAHLIRTIAVPLAICLSTPVLGHPNTPRPVREATIQPDTK